MLAHLELILDMCCVHSYKGTTLYEHFLPAHTKISLPAGSPSSPPSFHKTKQGTQLSSSSCDQQRDFPARWLTFPWHCTLLVLTIVTTFLSSHHSQYPPPKMYYNICATICEIPQIILHKNPRVRLGLIRKSLRGLRNLCYSIVENKQR